MPRHHHHNHHHGRRGSASSNSDKSSRHDNQQQSKAGGGAAGGHSSTSGGSGGVGTGGSTGGMTSSSRLGGIGGKLSLQGRHTVVQNALVSVHTPLARRELNMEFCLYLYIVCFILLQNYNLYGLNLHYYNFALLQYTAVRALRRLVVAAVRQSGLAHTWWRPRVLMRHIRRAPQSWDTITVAVITGLAVVMMVLRWLMLLLQLATSATAVFMLLMPDVAQLAHHFIVQRVRAALRRPHPHGHGLNFAMVLSSILLDAFDVVYCVGLLPLALVQYPHVVIDYRSSVVLVALATLGAVVHMLATVMAVRSTSLVLQARELGSWVQCAAPDAMSASVAVWVPGKVYRRGEVVAHKHSHYKAQSDTNTADPTHLPSSILHLMWSRPAQLHAVLLGALLNVVVVEVVFIAFSGRVWTTFTAMLGVTLTQFCVVASTLRADERYVV